jgi:hypothetical protein
MALKFISNHSCGKHENDTIIYLKGKDTDNFNGLMECIAFPKREPTKEEIKLFNNIQNYFVL